MKGGKGADMVRRPSSSAETSIDEDTADQLLADDFVLPATTATSRPGSSAYFARPASAIYDQRRSPSATSSSQGQIFGSPYYSRTKSPQLSMSNTEQTSYPPSVAIPVAPPIWPDASNYSLPDSLDEANTDPFRDPPELIHAVPAATPTVKPVPIILEKQPAVDHEIPPNPPPRRSLLTRKPLCIITGIVLLILIAVLIPVGLLVIKPKNNSADSTASSSSTAGLTKPDGRPPSALGIPDSAIGTVLDSTKWLDWTDFNVTYTNDTVGGLSIMGLNSTWSNSAQANSNVPPLTETFPYGKQPIKGISIGGWLILEPYITPSLFSSYSPSQGIVDEYTLSSYLGQQEAAQVLEEQYATFINKQSFSEMRDAGFDHVRISFPYWVIENVNANDPYVAKVGWRYLLRAIEYCREFGLRVNLCLHTAPGSQNGFDHSGHRGTIGWLNGTDGSANAERTTDFIGQLSTFFSQPRYTNLVTMFSILNEPNMVLLGAAPVNQWSKGAYAAARNAGFNGTIVISDGFLPPADFVNQFPQKDYPGMAIDMHNYVVFNSGNLAQTHQAKIGFACVAWSDTVNESVDATQGFGGPTIVGEWSIADTDCVPYLNGVGLGSRWLGTYAGSLGNANPGVPSCPHAQGCSCTDANTNASEYSTAYKTFLSNYFTAQTSSFEQSWGWFYWTWDTQNATQWSYKKLIDAGIVSILHQDTSFSCSQPTVNYTTIGLPETY